TSDIAAQAERHPRERGDPHGSHFSARLTALAGYASRALERTWKPTTTAFCWHGFPDSALWTGPPGTAFASPENRPDRPGGVSHRPGMAVDRQKPGRSR